jgi:hypothetical protein
VSSRAAFLDIFQRQAGRAVGKYRGALLTTDRTVDSVRSNVNFHRERPV